MPKKFFISVYTIAKDEEKVAERWYNCFKEADEVCVLVNNCKDKTAKILRKLGAKVVEKNYTKFRFDVARNDAMKMCSPKATLLYACDMDDMVEPGWRAKLEHAWELGQQSGRSPNAIAFTYAVEYTTGGNKKQLQTFARHSIHTPDGWYWKFRIHEVLMRDTKKVFLMYPKFQMVSRPTKHEHGAYLGLLEEECKDSNCDARCIHLLAREYMINGRYNEAVGLFLRHLHHRGAVWNCERAASMKFLSNCYGFLKFPNAQELWLWKAMIENPRDRDAPFALGQLLIQKKEYRAAVAVLEKCLSIKEPELDYPSFILSAWSEHPWLCLAEARFYVGNWKGAEEALAQALTINPDNPIGKQMMIDIARNRAMGARPALPPPEVPRERIVIPELN